MATSIETWVDTFKRIPDELKEDNYFRLGTQVGKKLLGLVDQTVQPDEEIAMTLTQAKEDEEEYNPEWIAAIENMMQAYDKKIKIEDDFQRPSFTLEEFEHGPFGAPLHGSPEGSRTDDVAINDNEEGRTDVDFPMGMNQEREIVAEPVVTLSHA